MVVVEYVAVVIVDVVVLVVIFNHLKYTNISVLLWMAIYPFLDSIILLVIHDKIFKYHILTFNSLIPFWLMCKILGEKLMQRL